MATLEKVQAQIAKLQAQAESLVAKQSSGVIAKIRDMMEQHGLTIADIDAHLGAPKSRGPQGEHQDCRLFRVRSEVSRPKERRDLDRPWSCACVDRQCEGP